MSDKPKKQIEGLHVLMKDCNERYYSVPPDATWEYTEQTFMLTITLADGTLHALITFNNDVQPEKFTPVYLPQTIT